MLYYKELYDFNPSLYNVAAYIMYGIYAKKSFLEIMKGHPSKLKTVIMYIPAYLKYLLKEKK